ncbi:helix-hairpin-helix domain-containing protein [Cytophagaceae bacterium ABcell3]|nr:helix-hairpin-helix domain-containing protein [Cytophagaceae bacterium ABcell3]
MKKKVVYWLKITLGFTTREANAFIALLLIIAALASVSHILPYFSNPDYLSYKEDKQILDSLLQTLEKPEAQDHKRNNSYPLTSFDPNEIEEEDWLQMGIEPAIAQRIEKYKQKGGVFKEKEDLLKIYNFSHKEFERISDYISIDLKESKTNKHNQSKQVLTDQLQATSFDINLSDTTQLKKIPGIGPVLSSRIIKYRRALGGFHSLEQLYEVYHLDSAIVPKLMERAFVAPNFEPAKININTATYKTLVSHPYISPKQASLIVAYRKQHKLYKEPKDLLQVKPLDKDWLQKVAPYIKVEK